MDIFADGITLGSRWHQTAVKPSGERLTRVVTVVGVPTPSSPVQVLIERNDAHPHRKGKKVSIRKADLQRKYREVRA